MTQERERESKRERERESERAREQEIKRDRVCMSERNGLIKGHDSFDRLKYKCSGK